VENDPAISANSYDFYHTENTSACLITYPQVLDSWVVWNTLSSRRAKIELQRKIEAKWTTLSNKITYSSNRYCSLCI
jgi:hypothetical protein